MKSAKDECEELMSAVLPRTEQLLSERAFATFGATMTSAGEIAFVSGASAAEIQAELTASATSNQIRVAALVYGLRTVPPGGSTEQDAVAIKLDHTSSYCVVVTFPYEYASKGELVVHEPFANELENSPF